MPRPIPRITVTPRRRLDGSRGYPAAHLYFTVEVDGRVLLDKRGNPRRWQSRRAAARAARRACTTAPDPS